MGSNMIMIQPGAGMMGGVRQSGSSMQSLKLEDYKSIRDNVSYIAAISPSVNSSGQFIYSQNNYPSSISGVNTEYFSIRKLNIDEGTIFTDQQIGAAAKVCVVGQTIIKNLFTNGEDPIGKVIRFNKIPFTIIGTLKKKGYNSMGMDQDDIVLAPYTTIQKRILAITHIQGIYASATAEGVTEKATSQIKTILRTNHKLKTTDDDDFNVRSQEELSTMLTSTSDMMTILLACIAGISLLVGGIGIMNIMYVSVTERTREIGLRMSIGAKGSDILAQFLIEAVLISFTGGIIGVILGIGATLLVNTVFSWPISIQLYTVFLSFLVCTITGIFFGWYPAKNAAQLDPIEAIRYE
jgi:putative ABC transport system permease protein